MHDRSSAESYRTRIVLIRPAAFPSGLICDLSPNDFGQLLLGSWGTVNSN